MPRSTALSGPNNARRALLEYDGGGTVCSTLTAGADIFAFWNADVFNNDQYALAVVGNPSASANLMHVIVRASGAGDSAFNSYDFYTDGTAGAGHCEVAKWIAGVKTVLANFATAFAAGDVMKISIVGSLITCYQNGASIGTATDSALTSGSAGCGINSLVAGVANLDDWEGGNVGGPGVVIALGCRMMDSCSTSLLMNPQS